jgi:hypothetical protein
MTVTTSNGASLPATVRTRCCCLYYGQRHRLSEHESAERGRRDQLLRSRQMIFLGIVLLIIGFVASVPIFWTIGIVLVFIGIVLELMGMAGHAVAGRRHYY